MSADSEFFGGEQEQGMARERIDHVPLPDGRIRMMRSYFVESIAPGWMLVERVRQEILCEWAGDQWVTPGETGELIDGFVLCRRCARSLRSRLFWRKVFSPFLKKDTEAGQELPEPGRRLLR